MIILFACGVLAFAVTNPSTETLPTDTIVVHYFFLPTCPHCAEQRPIVDALAQELPTVQFVIHDASSTEGAALFHAMATANGLTPAQLAVPALFIGNIPRIGVQTREQLITTIEQCKLNCTIAQPETTSRPPTNELKEYTLPLLGSTDLTTMSLPILAILLGLIDGFNPCAMWVLVYLISILIGMNDRRKIQIIVGSFVLASGILYFLFMAAWINLFLFLGYIRILTILVGLVALGGGSLSLHEYFTTKGAMTCNVGDAKSHEKMMSRVQTIISQPLTLTLILSIILLAFMVNTIEFACSAAIPAVFTQVLALHQLPVLLNYAYIGLYVFFFMLDDLIIFSMAAFTIGTVFGDRYARYCRLIGGSLLVVLGTVMLFAPELLR